MSILSGLIALALLNAEPPAAECRAPIDFQIQVLDMESLDWRGKVHYQLQPVTAKGQPNVWHAKSSLAPVLCESAARVYANMQLRCVPDIEASAFHGVERSFVSRLNRIANGPIDHANAVAFGADLDSLRDGVEVTVFGTDKSAGVLTRVIVDETCFKAFHTVSVRETVRSDNGKGETTISAQYQVPELLRSRVEVAQTIPADGVLVLSLGVRARRDSDMKEESPYERLVLISAKPASEAESARGTLAAVRGHERSAFQTPHARPVHPDAKALLQAWRRVASVRDQAAVGASGRLAQQQQAGSTPPPPPVPSAPPLPQAPGVSDAQASARAASPSALRTPSTCDTRQLDPISSSIAAITAALASPTAGLIVPGITPAAESDEDENESPMPSIPSRSIPLAIRADGTEYERPHVPESVSSVGDDEASDRTSASPQSKHVPSETAAPRDRVRLARATDEHCPHCGSLLRTSSVSEIERDDDGRECDTEILGELQPIDAGSIILSHVPGDGSQPPRDDTAAEKAADAGLPPLPKTPVLACPPPIASGTTQLLPPTEPRALLLRDAIRIALKNSPEARVLAAGNDQPTFITATSPDSAPARFRAEISGLVQGVHQAYWGLKLQQDRMQIAHATVALAELALNNERPRDPSRVRRTSASPSAQETLGQWRLACLAAAENFATAQHELSQEMRLEGDPRRILLSVPDEQEPWPHRTWNDCLAALRDTNPDVLEARDALNQAQELALLARRPGMVPTDGDAQVPADPAFTRAVAQVIPVVRNELAKRESHLMNVARGAVHDLAVHFAAVESGDKRLLAAVEQTKKAWTAVEINRALHQIGWIGIDDYLESIRVWSNAARVEAETRSRANVAVTALARSCGALLERENIVVIDSIPPTARVVHHRDTETAQTEDSNAERAVHRRPMTATETAETAAPMRLRLPFGVRGFMEIRASVKRTPAGARAVSESAK